MKLIKKNLILYWVLIGLSVACVKDQDFDQYKDIRVDPVITGSILYAEATENLINQITGTDFYSTTFYFKVFSDPEVARRVRNGELTYQVENATSKPMEIQIEFMDKNGTLLDKEVINADPASSEPFVETRTIIYGTGGKSIDIIKNTYQIKFVIKNLGDHTSVSTLPDPKIIVRSSGEFKIGLK